MASADDVQFLIDLSSGDAQPLPELTLQSVGLRERDDLQRWVSQFPEIVGPGLLLVTSEFDQWEVRDVRVPDRLDVLFLDQDGYLVVGELKRDRAADTVDLQALKYAAYCARLTSDDIAEEYARFHKVELEAAAETVQSHAPALIDGPPTGVRIRLIAGSFGPAVTSVVLWLREHDLDIGCVEVTARGGGNGTAVLSARQLLPLPEAEDYMVGRRRREQEQQVRTAAVRGENTIKVLSEADILVPGITLKLAVDTLASRWRPALVELLERDPSAGIVTWTGEVVAKSLRWEHDGEIYSATGATKKILELAGIASGSIAGPDHWLLPDGRAMYRAAVQVRAGAG